MRKLILILLLMLAATTAKAGWYEYSPGWFINGTLEANDGWAYRKYCNCYGCQYVRYSYLPAASSYGGNYNTTNTTVTYTKNWKTDLVQALSANKDSELFISAVEASGLKASFPGGLRYAASQGYGGAYASSGVTTVAEGYGFAQPGSTVYGLAAVPSYGRLDTTLATHELQRTTDGLVTGAIQVGNVIGANIREAVQGDTEAAKIYAAGQAAKANAEAAAIITRSVQEQKTTRQEWRQDPVLQPAQQPQQFQQLPAQPQPDMRQGGLLTAPVGDQYVLARVRGEVKFQATCAGCHSADSKQGAKDFSSLDRWAVNERALLADEADSRMRGDKKPSMPKDHPLLASLDRLDIKAYLAGP